MKKLIQTARELVNKYGKEIAAIVVEEIIREYDKNICHCGYDYDHNMWNAQKEDWIKVRQEIEHL